MPVRRLCILVLVALISRAPIAFAQSQEEKAVAELITKAFAEVQRDPVNGPAMAESLLREALETFRKAPNVAPERFAEASVLVSLFLLGQQRPAASFRPQIEEAVRTYETAAPPIEDARMALALEVLAALPDTPGDQAMSLRRRTTAIRQRLVEALRMADEGADSPPPAGVRRIGGGVTAPKIRQKQEPQYSESARLARRQGSALLSIVIGTDGKPRNIKLVRSLGFGLDEAAYRAVKTWEFEPATADGEPVRVSANVEVNFRLL